MFNNNNPLALMNELNGLSKVMGRSDVRTTFQGNGAYTDGTIINVPAMDMNAVLSDRDMAAMRGYHIHEVAHVTDTDNDVWRNKRVTNRKRTIWNAMEDVYIERKAQEQYAGARKNLQAVCDMVLEGENKIDNEHRAEGIDPYETWWESLDYAALQLARKAMGYESPALDEYIENLPPQLRDEAQQFVDDALACESTEDTLELAGKIDRRIKALGKANEDGSAPDPQQGKGNDDEGNSADDDGEAQDSGGEPSDDEGEQQGSNSPSQGVTSEERMERANSVASTIAAKHKPDARKPVERRVALTFKSYDDYHAYLCTQLDTTPSLQKPKYDRAKSFVSSISRPYYNKNYADLLEALSRDEKQRLYAARIARLLLAREDKRYVGGQLEGRVDRRRLAQLVAGQRNVFTTQETLRTDDTIVTIAVDASGSMDADGTRLAAACLNECLLRANVDYELLAWTGYSNSPYDISWNVIDGDAGMCPFNSNGIVEVKSQAQRGNNPEVRKMIANLLTQQGVTPTWATMAALAQRMMAKTQERRIVLFVTDGAPNGSIAESREVGTMVRAMGRIGIEVIGVAIGDRISDTLMEHMFGKTWVQCDTERLAETMLGQIEKLLIGRAHEAA